MDKINVYMFSVCFSIYKDLQTRSKARLFLKHIALCVIFFSDAF